MTVTRGIWRAVRIAAGVCLLAYVLWGSDWRMLGSLLAKPWAIVVVVGVALFGAAVEAVRLGILFDAQGLQLPFRTGFQAVAIATFFNACIPGSTGGDIVKVWYLNAFARERSMEIAAIWLVDRLTGLFSLLALVVAIGIVNLPFVDAHPALRWLLGSAILALVALVTGAGLATPTLSFRLCRALGWYPPVQRAITRIASAIDTFRRRPGALLKAVVVSSAGNAAMLGAFVTIGRYLMPGVAPQLVCLLALFGIFGNAVPLTPGGLGVGETAFHTLFRFAGVGTGAALLVAWRIGSLPTSLLGWFFYVAGVRHGAQRPTHDESSKAAIAVPY